MLTSKTTMDKKRIDINVLISKAIIVSSRLDINLEQRENIHIKSSKIAAKDDINLMESLCQGNCNCK